MDKGMGFLTIAGSCVAVLFVVLVKHKAEVIMNFCIRAVLGQMPSMGSTVFFLPRRYLSGRYEFCESFDIRNPWFQRDFSALRNFGTSSFVTYFQNL